MPTKVTSTASLDFPQDLRGMSGGLIEDERGNKRVYHDQVQAYENAVYVYNETKLDLAYLNHLIAVGKNLSPMKLKKWPFCLDLLAQDLEFVMKFWELSEGEPCRIRKRIKDAFDHELIVAKTSKKKIDKGARSKVLKALDDIDAGKYDRNKISKTHRAVKVARKFFHINERMPTHAELKEEGFNDQQATDAGAWIKKYDPLYPPLHVNKLGRPKKQVEHSPAPKKEKKFVNILNATYRAFIFPQKNNRMPTHAELKEMGFNDEQATDVGKWLADSPLFISAS